MEVITELLDKYDTTKDKQKLNNQFLSSLLKELRKTQLRRPDIVLDHGFKLLKYESGNDVWNLQEQICVAAIDCGKTSLAEECVKTLLMKFPESARANRIIGMKYEMEGKYKEATEVYAKILATNPSNIMALKRLICISKANSDLKQTIDLLNSLLRQYPSDASSWQELAEVYTSICDFEAAAHCFEELILLEPINAHYHARLADIYYSIGGAENVLNARKHYTISLTHQNPSFNMRALYGLLYACQTFTELCAEPDSKSSNQKSVVKSTSSNSGTGTGSRANETGMESSPFSEISNLQHELSLNKELLNWAKAQLTEVADSLSQKNSTAASFVAEKLV